MFVIYFNFGLTLKSIIQFYSRALLAVFQHDLKEQEVSDTIFGVSVFAAN